MSPNDQKPRGRGWPTPRPDFAVSLLASRGACGHRSVEMGLQGHVALVSPLSPPAFWESAQQGRTLK